MPAASFLMLLAHGGFVVPTDLDECNTPGKSNCSVHATCTNVLDGGGYNCSCNAGYTGEAFGGTCVGVCPRSVVHTLLPAAACSHACC